MRSRMFLSYELNSVYQCVGRDSLHMNNKNAFVVSINNTLESIKQAETGMSVCVCSFLGMLLKERSRIHDSHGATPPQTVWWECFASLELFPWRNAVPPMATRCWLQRNESIPKELHVKMPQYHTLVDRWVPSQTPSCPHGCHCLSSTSLLIFNLLRS